MTALAGPIPRRADVAACEKCWTDAHFMYAGGQGAYESLVDAYHALLVQRKAAPCSPEERAGDWWDLDRQVDGREES